MKSFYKYTKRNFNYYLDYHKDNAVNKILKGVVSLNYQNLKQYGLADHDFLHPEKLYPDPNFAQVFVNEVIACCLDKNLLNHSMISKEAKEMAKIYLSNIVMGAYSDSNGITMIRENFIKRVKEVEGVDPFKLNSIFLTSGSINALDNIATAIFQNGDQIMIPNPINPTILNYNKTKDLVNIEYRVDGGKIDLDDLQILYNRRKRYGPIKAFLFSNPQEPTGKVYTKEEVERVIRFCHENELVLIAWEASRQMIHDQTKTPFNSTLKVLCEMEEPIRSQVELFDIYSSSKGFPNVASIRSACFTMLNIDKKVADQIVKYKSIDLCSSIPSQIVFDLVMNRSMYSVLGKSFKDKYEKEIDIIRDKLIFTKNNILKDKSINVEINDVDSGYNMFAKLKYIEPTSFIRNYYKNYNEGLVSPGHLFGVDNEEYVNILLNADGDYGFLKPRNVEI